MLAICSLLLVSAPSAAANPFSPPREDSPPEQQSGETIAFNPQHQPACDATATASPCRVFLPSIERPLVRYVSLPVGLNAGGDAVTLSNGRRYQADRPYSVTDGIGYVDGSPVAADWDWEPIDGTADDTLYRAGRAGMTAYRFHVPPGNYLVHLSFAEIRRHGPGFRVFDAFIEDTRVIRSLDIYEQVQHDYALDYRFPAKVLDRSLDITFVGTIEEPVLSGIWISAREPDVTAPPVPTSLEAIGGYDEIILDWADLADDDVQGYRVYKGGQATGPFTLAHYGQMVLSRFVDRAVTAGDNTCYRVAAIDVYGNESGLSAVACAAAVSAADATLPYFQLQVSESNLRKLNGSPAANDYVPATLQYDGNSYRVETHYRGNMSRWCNKKSWKIRFLDPSPWPNTDVLLLNAECHDPTLIKEKVTYDLMQDLGVRAGTARFVLLQLNDRFVGVYTQVENPDTSFLLRTGRDPNGNLYKCSDGLDLEPDCANQVHESRDKTDLYNFAALVNNTPDGEFAWAIAQVLDVRGFLDYLAVKALVGDADATVDYLLYHDVVHDHWEVLPWDNNAGFQPRMTTLPVDYGSAQHPDYNGQQNVLITRVLAVPQFRAYYGQRLAELSTTLFSEPAMQRRFDSAIESIWSDATRDLWKLNREDNAAARAAVDLLPAFVRQRTAYLSNVLPSYTPAQTTYLYLNEVLAHNTSTLIDPADGDTEPWLELFNAGLRPVALGGRYLSNDLRAPTRFRIPPGTTIPALGYLVFWLDNEPLQGPLHTNFTLPSNGGQLVLFDQNNGTLLDQVEVAALPADVAWARFPDGGGGWQAFSHPSPGRSNVLLAPLIAAVQHLPLYPQADNRPVAVTARVTDPDGQITAVDLYFRGDRGFTVSPMADDGLSSDGDAGDGVYGALVPPYPLHTEVLYYVVARDDQNRTARSPEAAPTLTYRYRVGFLPPLVQINEFMAANDSTMEDPDEPGEYPDWIELHNLSAQSLALGGMYLTDELSDPRRFRIPNAVTIPPAGFVIFWADDDPAQGPTHTNFKLNAGSEAVGLFAADGATLIDSVLFTNQRRDVSLGRCPDGVGSWRSQFIPTPGRTNACRTLFFPR